jgi:hypothetical protein
MKLNYTYNKDKDIWCLLNKGKSSNNNPNPTRIYKQLLEFTGENLDENSTSIFIDKYIKNNQIDIKQKITDYQKSFDNISNEFQRVAEKVFGISLKDDITVYLTINTRCPYNIQENLFFVSLSNKNNLHTAMHELWHFYTWYKFGFKEQERIGKEKYNEIKEALTVLLNIECSHLLPKGLKDEGYPQHQELRNKILKLWKQNPNIDFIWKEITL